MSVLILRADAARLPLPDACVDLIITSPPYWSQRSYTDDGVHYSGQIGAEATPGAYIDNLLRCTREWIRVLKPTGSIWVNLGDKYATRYASGRAYGRAGFNNDDATRSRTGQNRTGVAEKSLIGLPWRYAIGCIDALGLTLRAEVIWNKPNGLPESVTDRVRRSHEQWFHFTLQPRYFAAVDLVREAYDDRTATAAAAADRSGPSAPKPLGKLPGSVWSVASQPLKVPAELGVNHFAAFPMTWPRRIITGWSPSCICTVCGEARQPVLIKECGPDRPGRVQERPGDTLIAAHGADARAGSRKVSTARLTGEACACSQPGGPARPALVLDPFGGTGTTAIVADALGRYGISADMSGDYCRLAQWRSRDRAHRARAAGGNHRPASPARRVTAQQQHPGLWPA